MAKFKIINSDQGHNYTHYVEAPDKQIAMDRFKAGHYGSIIDCEEIVSLSSTPDPVEPTAKGMDELKIYRFQAKHIEDTFRLVQRIFECNKKVSSVDRDVMQSWQMIKNVLSGRIDEHVPRL